LAFSVNDTAHTLILSIRDKSNPFEIVVDFGGFLWVFRSDSNFTRGIWIN